MEILLAIATFCGAPLVFMVIGWLLREFTYRYQVIRRDESPEVSPPASMRRIS